MYALPICYLTQFNKLNSSGMYIYAHYKLDDLTLPVVIYLQINGSLARRAIKDLMERGLIRMVSIHSSQQIFTRATNT
ncbi:unnamed protein product [Triticum turgidum subsp. durum]|uniref:40S ribosomal protein S25 n=1 Tax=Triticum turgidum subsp. durum TaxID=4567 RepID=A0A9R1BTM4_TRITD|nr:unnamed protein product [Triticum turgidum subsp. durum]